jgi:two-component system LytT family response regulator
MVKACIVDDEPHCCEFLSGLLKSFCPEVQIINVCHSGAEALAVIKKSLVQLLFLDIELPDMSGFEIMEKIEHINFELIFMADYDHDAIQAIHFSALDYLLKPIDAKKLQQAVQKTTPSPQRKLTQQIGILLQKLKNPVTTIHKIAVPTMEGLQMIFVDTILYCTAHSNYTTFSLKGNKKLISSRTLKEVEELLAGHCFIRVHHSCVVNLNEVNKYIKGLSGQLIMSDCTTINVSRSRKEMLLKALQPGKLFL